MEIIASNREIYSSCGQSDGSNVKHNRKLVNEGMCQWSHVQKQEAISRQIKIRINKYRVNTVTIIG